MGNFIDENTLPIYKNANYICFRIERAVTV